MRGAGVGIKGMIVRIMSKVYEKILEDCILQREFVFAHTYDATSHRFRQYENTRRNHHVL